MMLVGPQESEAHRQIIGLISLRKRRMVSRAWVEWTFSRLAPVFAPRCNCGGLLVFTRLPSHTVARCVCGWVHTEHPINA